MSRFIKSKIDGKTYSVSNGQFTRHLRDHNLSRKDYYEIYVTGVTPLCHCLKPRTFYPAKQSYAETCGDKKCAIKIAEKRRSNRSESEIQEEFLNRSRAHQRRTKQEIILIAKKRRETNLKRYGHNTPAENEQIKAKVKTYFQNQYGVDHPMQLPEIKSKLSKSVKMRYGVTAWAKGQLSDKALAILDNSDQFAQYLDKMSTKELSDFLECDRTTIYDRIHRYDLRHKLKDTSFLEDEMAKFLTSISVDFVRHDRSIIAPKELDFYLEKFKIAIEMNGDYWHSTFVQTDKYYHYNKWKECRDRGVQLIQIFESDWLSNKEKIKNMIKSRVGLQECGVPARKTHVEPIHSSMARKFLDAYHLQGFVGGCRYYGAFAGDELIGVMTFGMTRNQRFELKRWATDNKIHCGLFSKVFKHAQKELNFREVVSFSMNDWFTGDVYSKCGFELKRVLPPSYFYSYKNKRTHMMNFTRRNIQHKLPEYYDIKLTEQEMMLNAGIPRIYDSGKIEWVWENNS